TLDSDEDNEFYRKLAKACMVVWTTTPWTLPGNRAISYSPNISYGLYEVTGAPEDNWAQKHDLLILADDLANSVSGAARIEELERIGPVDVSKIHYCSHPLKKLGYGFQVPLLAGSHVTDDTGTGFVHTAPGHGADDYIIWMEHKAVLDRDGIKTSIPFTVDGDGVYTDQAPGFAGKRVLKENGSKGDANDAVINALADAGNIIARSRLKHQYPHSWRSKKPVIFRNTPQWFIAMDKPPLASDNHSLRELALAEIKKTKWVPAGGQNRITGMIENRPDWVVSRQRAWGVPITVFRNPKTDEIIPGPTFDKSDALIARIEKAFHAEGADVWFRAGAKEKFLKGLVDNPDEWEQVRDVLDVWFDSGCTHAFTLEDGDAFPGLQGIKRANDGGNDRVMYLEGSDQHRGWFHSSLLESCGTRGQAPYDVVVTHGFVLDPKGQKMAKSVGNVVAPQDVIKQSGADILRLWVAASDYSDDLRIGPDILKTFMETYRKLRNTLRWMLGALGHFEDAQRVAYNDLPELERLMLHELSRIDEEVRAAYGEYDFRKVVAALAPFLNTDLSAFYFDIRKDTLYCEAYSSKGRHAALTVIDHIFTAVTHWLAPILSFTAEEAWLIRNADDAGSVHLQPFPEIPNTWRDDALAAKWETIRTVRRVVTGALEIERAEKRMGSSLEAAPEIYIKDKGVFAVINTLDKQDLADICITSGVKVINKAPPSDAFVLQDVPGVGVLPKKADGKKCARSWRITSDVGVDPRYPDLSARDAAAVAEFDAMNDDTVGADT
ncbi:MAG: class I tRNA ligase family protein, partial [Alphaproteobacteria bacterium]|nr:class I tRNA ligase family protein [Alphaproteobacteria bacterium]